MPTASSPTTGKRKRHNNNTIQQEQQEQQQQQTGDLNKDYATIAQLLAKLDNQSEVFSEKMKHIIETAPSHDGLATLWEEQTGVLRMVSNHQVGVSSPQKQESTTTSGQSRITNMIDDEVNDDPNDPLLLL